MATTRVTENPSTLKLVAAFGAVYIIWGSTYLGIRFAIETLPPFLMSGVRFLIAGGLLYGWVLLRGAPRPGRRAWLAAGTVGALLLLGGNGAVTWAEQTVPSGLAALLIATEPLWITLLDWARPGGTRPGPRAAGGLALGFVGVALLVGPVALGDAGGVDPVGAVVVVLAALSWAAGSLYALYAPLPSWGLQATGMQMLAGGALLTGAGLLSGEWGEVDLAGVSLRSALAFLYLLFFGSLVAFSAYAWLIKVAPPSRVATYAYVNPVVAVFLGWALAGESVTLRTVVAAAIIVTAVALITTYRTRAEESPAKELAYAGGSGEEARN